MNNQYPPDFIERQVPTLLLKLWSRKLLEEAQRPSVFARMFPPKPLTRMQKLRHRLSMYGYRLRNAGDALRGIEND